MVYSKSLVGALLALAMLCVIACGDDHSGPGTNNSNHSSYTAQVHVIDGVEVRSDLALCVGSMSPTVSAHSVTFEWPEIADANRYAVQAYQSEGQITVISDELLMYSGIQETRSYTFHGRASGVMYMLQVYALNDDTPLCLLGGVNMVGPF